MTLLSATNLSKSFRMGDSTVSVLSGTDFSLAPGEFVAIEGRSGSGKSTLLHLLGLLDAPSTGSIIYNNQDLTRLSPSARAKLRNTHFGFVFQFYHLLPELNVLENVLITSMVGHSFFAFRSAKSDLTRRATTLLGDLGLSHRLKHRPSQLSGGERQRVAIARALINNPRVLLADEPTGNLDVHTGSQIMDVLSRLHRSSGQSIVMVTHDRTLAHQADRALLLTDGKLVAP